MTTILPRTNEHNENPRSKHEKPFCEFFKIVQEIPKGIVDVMAKIVVAKHIYKICIEIFNTKNDIRHF